MAVEIDMLGGNCPVQAQGKIDGEPFYFRARGEHWSICIGSDVEDDRNTSFHGRDVIGNPRWYFEEEWGAGPYDAGWMEMEEARQMIEAAAARYRAGEPSMSDI